MITVLLYNFILLMSTFYIYLSEKSKTKVEYNFFITIAFLIVFIPSSIRYDIGTDFMSYINVYNNLEDFYGMEKGFYYINVILKNLDLSSQWVFVISSFLITLVAFKSYPEKNGWLIHFVFITILWFFSFNVLRQSIALSFSMLAIFYFINGRIFLFITVSLLGTLFHNSSIFIILIGIFALVPIKRFIKIYLFPIFSLILIIILYIKPELFFEGISTVLTIFNFDRYANYFLDDINFARRDFGSGLATFIKIIFCIYFLINTKNIIKLNERYWLVSLIVLFYVLFTILSDNIIIFERATYIFAIGPIFAVYIVYLLPNNKIINRILVFIFICILFAIFTKDGFSFKTNYGDPNRNPYKTIF